MSIAIKDNSNSMQDALLELLLGLEMELLAWDLITYADS